MKDTKNLFKENIAKLTGQPEDVSDKILLIDADTIVYATCSSIEYPANEEETEWSIDLEQALDISVSKVEELLSLTGCKSAELHFTSGKNFRYSVLPDYKAIRKDTRYPVGIRELKTLMLKDYPGKINIDFEADDVVCMLKREYPDKYIIAAVDKDVLNGVAGTHFNYYKNVKYKIPMKWVTTTKEQAMRFPYLQSLMGDSADGIKGVPRCGPKGADKLLGKLTSEKEIQEACIQKYLDAGMTEKEFITTMRLVSMNQVTKEGNLNLWTLIQ